MARYQRKYDTPWDAKQEIIDIYTERGLPLPANIDVQARRNFNTDGAYASTIIAHADRNAADPGQLEEFNRTYSRRGGTTPISAPGDTFTSPGQASPGTEPTDSGVDRAVSRDSFADEFPWLRGRLLDVFTDLWVQTGDSPAALSRLRNTSEYQAEFPGIRRDDGTLRMDENTYWSEREGVAEIAAEFGFDPTKYRKLFPQMVELGIDSGEFGTAVQESVTRFTEPGGERTELADMFLQQFLDTGSQQVALENVRDSSQYDQVFAGNRRDDGTLRMSEPAYFGYQRGWRRMFLSRGINPEPFESQGLMVEAIQGENSVDELNAKMDSVESGILNKSPDVLATFGAYYGHDGAAFLAENPSLSTALAMAVSPKVGNELLNRRISAAQIGGEAKLQGFLRDIDRAEELARAGVTQQQARQVYGQAARTLPGISATTERFRRGRTSLGQFEDAFALGDGSERQRVERSLQAERSSFSGRSDVRRDGLGLAGLRRRG